MAVTGQPGCVEKPLGSTRATVGLQLRDGILLLVMTFGLSGFADADTQETALLELAENVRTSLRAGVG